MKMLRTLLLVVVLLISATWGRDYLGRRAERSYFAGLASQVHEDMCSDEAVRAINAWMTAHPQGGGEAMKQLRPSAANKGEMKNFVLNGNHHCALEVKFEDGKVAEIVRSGF